MKELSKKDIEFLSNIQSFLKVWMNYLHSAADMPGGLYEHDNILEYTYLMYTGYGYELCSGKANLPIEYGGEFGSWFKNEFDRIINSYIENK